MSRIRNAASGLTQRANRASRRLAGAAASAPVAAVSERFSGVSPKAVARAVASVMTAAGWFCIGLVLLWVPLGASLRWVEFSIAGFAALLLLLFALPFLIGGQSYSVHFEPDANGDIRITAGEAFETTVVIENSSSRLEMPGQLESSFGEEHIAIRVPLLGAFGVYRHNLRRTNMQRGKYVLAWRSIRKDPLSLVRREVPFGLEDEANQEKTVWVHPQIAKVGSPLRGIIKDLEGNPSAQLVDSDTSFHAIREYRAGDSSRHIHWASTAKIGKIGEFMVRQFQETRRSRVVLMLGAHMDEYQKTSAGKEWNDEFEMAVSALGSVGYQALRDGRTVTAVMGKPRTGEVNHVGRGASKASIRELKSATKFKLLDSLSEVRLSTKSSQRGLKEVSLRVGQTYHDVSLVVIFCGSTVTDQQLRVIRQNLPKGIGVLAVLSNPNGTPSMRTIDKMKVATITSLEQIGPAIARFQR
jgi:uncharacterized protein (DUF58 family)